MIRRSTLVALAVLLWASPALAIDTFKFPWVLMDSTCTDLYDTVGGWGIGTTFVQTSGSPDGKCDNDSRILTGPVTADTYWGPLNAYCPTGFLLLVDADTVSNGTDTWRIVYGTYKPHDGAFQNTNAFATKATQGDVSYQVSRQAGSAVQVKYADNLPDNYYIGLDLISATSWDGMISMVCEH